MNRSIGLFFQEEAVMQPGPDFNPYAAPSERVDREVGAGFELNAGPLAPLGHRWLGAFLDNLFMVGSLLPGTLLFIFRSETNPELAFGLMVLLGLPFLVVQSWLISTTGQSIAKKLLKTKIVTVAGEPPGFVRGVLLRSWLIAALSSIPMVGGVVSLVDALMIFRTDRRTMHDHIAGTNVIQVL
ncbi:MAG TPA: RDD family protein [Polyangiaceae bacterium]|nr:RDD family protein [Polyangiaceae bacterium]